jgi:hypothetical protein
MAARRRTTFLYSVDCSEIAGSIFSAKVFHFLASAWFGLGAAVVKQTKFKTGVSGCPEKQFKPGNPHRWQPGQSGNPSGIPRNRLKFEQAFYAALLGQGSAEEAAALLWEPARAHEPWAVQALLQRLVPQTQQIKLTHEV